MGKNKTAKPAGAQRPADEDQTDIRELALEALLELHWDFADLDRLDEAAPLLHRLMEIAYYAGMPAGPRDYHREPGCKPTVN